MESEGLLPYSQALVFSPIQTSGLRLYSSPTNYFNIIFPFGASQPLYLFPSSFSIRSTTHPPNHIEKVKFSPIDALQAHWSYCSTCSPWQQMDASGQVYVPPAFTLEDIPCIL
jgi:hypothetical protein